MSIPPTDRPPVGGRYFMQRGWQEDPFFPSEPFTQREAWEWLIAHAAWKAHKTRIGDYVIDLERGQLCHSVRFMGDCWQWKRSKVQRFLKRLKTDTRIGTVSDTGITIVTLCNYEKSQNPSSAGDTPADTPSGPDAGHLRDKTEERRKKEEYN